MKRISSLVLLCLVVLMTTGAAAKWSTPVQIAGTEAAFWPSLSDDGQTVTWLKLSGLSSDDSSGLSVLLSQMQKGKW